MEPLYDDAVFGRWVRRRRRALDLTQKELARRVGCSAAMVRKIEREERRPSRRIAAALGTVLGVADAEREAFVRFARTGWADGPPDASLTGIDRPWAAPRRHGPPPQSVEGDVGAVPPAGPGSGVRRPAAGDRDAAPRVGAAGARLQAKPAIVARDAELQRLTDALLGSFAHRGRVSLVAGESGQGKSTLLRAFAGQAQADHPTLLVATGTCNAFTGRGDPFLPFKEILQQLMGDFRPGSSSRFEQQRARRLQQSMVAVSRIVLEYGPHLADTLLPGERFVRLLREADVDQDTVAELSRFLRQRQAVPAGGSSAEPSLRSETVEVLSRISLRTPLLLILDDLQWADVSSLELLLHLARRVSSYPILIVGSYRPAEIAADRDGSRHPLERIVNELARQFGDLVIDLDDTDGRAFLEALLDTEPNRLGPEFREALWRQTGGQPLFTVELLRSMKERGDLARDERGRWMAGADLTWGALPTRISGTLQERVAQLSPSAFDVLRTASVEGEAFTAEVVATVLGTGARSVVEVIASELGRGRQFVTPGSVARSAEGLVARYRFRHGLFQRYVYDELDEGERAYLHEAVARALLEVFGEAADPVAVAYHFGQAQSPEEAAPFHGKAGDRARRSGAIADAVSHYRSALAGGTDLGPRERGWLLRNLGDCLWLTYQVDEAIDTLHRARAAFEVAGADRLVGAVEFQIGRILYDRQPDARAALEAYRRGLALLEDGSETAELARGLSAVAQVHMEAGEDEQALAHGQRALAMAERLRLQDARADALMTVGTVLARSGPERREEGLAMLRESSDKANASGSFTEAIYGGFGVSASYCLAELYQALGRLEDARSQWDVCTERAGRHGMVVMQVDTQMQRWRLDWRRGRWAGSLAFLADLRERRRDGAKTSFGAAAAELDLGRAEEAHALMERHAARALAPIILPLRVFALRELLRAAAALGNAEDADRFAFTLAEAAGRRSAYPGDVMAPLLTALRWLAFREGVRAREAANASRQVLVAAERQYGSPEARASVAEAEGTLAVARGDAPTGAGWLARAAELWQLAGYPLDRARAGCAAARAYDIARSPSEAERLERQSTAVLDGLAAQLPEGRLAAGFARVREAWQRGDGLYR